MGSGSGFLRCHPRNWAENTRETFSWASTAVTENILGGLVALKQKKEKAPMFVSINFLYYFFFYFLYILIYL